MQHRDVPDALNRLSEKVIGCAIKVHRALGPGLLERTYEESLVHEFRLQGIEYQQQRPVSLNYKGVELVGQRLDLVVEQVIVLELKAVEAVLDVHIAQLVGYMRAGPYPLGLLINFSTPALRAGIHRRVNSRAIVVSDSGTVSHSAFSA